MRKIFFLVCLGVLSFISFSQETAKVDPNHSQDGGYGYLINANQTCSVWWAEGAYKVLRDAPLPSRKDNLIRMWSAKNEYESFIVVIHPTQRMENFRITMPELTDGQGNTIGSENIIVRKVGYVKVTKPTDSYGFPGWWPDPIPVYDKPATIFPKENQPFWITVKVPAAAKAGNYSGNIFLSSGAWNLTVPVKLQVWDFILPKSPSMRSSLGLNMENVKEYENISNQEDEKEAFDYYLESFRDYKISPYNSFKYSPIKEDIMGVAWEGGFFDSEVKYAGTYSYRLVGDPAKLVNESVSPNIEGHTKHFIPVNSVDPYRLSWFSKSLTDEQNYVVGVECYNAEKELIVFENRFERYSGQHEWDADTMDLGTFNDEVRFIKIRLFPSNRTLTRAHRGTVWFDDINLYNTESKQNEFASGNFEVKVSDIDILLDFTEFNVAGKRYLDEFGFTSFQLSLKGLGSGNFFSRIKGVFAGFEQGTDEYNKLMERYLAQIQSNLEENGWLGKEYIYWFDEPNKIDYPFVKEMNTLIKTYAPKLTTFQTEHVSGQDISDVIDISCTIWHKLDHDKIKKMNEKGLEHWSYLCTWPKSPWISEFIDHDVINLRMWLWASYQYQLKGILLWETTHWNSNIASPEGYLQNPWVQAMSFVMGFGLPLVS